MEIASERNRSIMYYLEVERGIRIYIEDINPKGEKTVMLIHGWPMNRKMFEYQLNILPKYGFRCIVLDLRGFGNSDKPWSGYSYNRLADDVKVIIETLNLKDINLVGFSMGGAIAVRYMARHKGYKVSKLALLATAAPSFIKREGYTYGMTKEVVNDLIEKTYRDRPQMLWDFGDIFFASEITPSFKTWFQGLGLEAGGYSTIKTAISLRDEDLRNDLQKIEVPTGIFHGKLDKICSYEFALVMNKNIIKSKLYSFEHSGHGVFYDEVEKFNNCFLQFLCK